MTGKPFEVVNLLENNYAKEGRGATTISPSSPTVAETSTTMPLSTSPVPTQLRGVSPPESYNDISSTISNVSNSHSYQVAMMDYAPDGIFSSSLITATLCLGWITVAAVAFALLFWLNRVIKRRRALDGAGNVRSFLMRYDENDVRLLKSSLGGWHVVLGRRLVDRVRYYWTKELPGGDEASTILFDDDHTLPSHHSGPPLQSADHEVLSPGGCDTSSCGSLSSDDQTVLPQHNSGRRGQILSFQAISYHEGPDSANPGWHCQSSSNSNGSSRRLDQHQIQSFLHSQFPSDKILLSKSLPAGGFSVVYCNRFDVHEEVQSYDRIDFYPSQSDMDRIHDCSQPLFKHDDEIERALT